MEKNLKILLISLIFSLPLWWGVNALGEDLDRLFYWQEIAQRQEIFTARILLEKEKEDLKPFRNKEIDDLEIQAKSAISVLLNNQGKEKLLFAKDENQQLPIASLTKLMTALVVINYYDLEKEIKISQEAIKQEGNSGKLRLGQVLSTEYLLYPLLMESSNNASFALAENYENMNKEKFTELMNQEAEKLKMHETLFHNTSGLDPEESGTKVNYSTALDLIKLTKQILKEDLIIKILQTQTYSLYGPELTNTNKLLDEIPGIVAGKTGYTEKAGGCLVLVTQAPENQGQIIHVLLGAEGTQNRFWEMKKMVDWIEKAYKW